jgi:hypothetical protein
LADRIAAWAKNLEQRGNFFGILLRLLYEICVNAQFQSAVHVIASCVLGAFCYKNGKPNVCFLIVFAVTYLIIIVTFAISNIHRGHRNELIKAYEISLSKISKALQEECRKDINLYNSLANKSLEEMCQYYKNHDVFTETCFRVCAAVDELLQEISGMNSFCVMTFLRTDDGCDSYHINAYSPQEPVPEAYGTQHDLEAFKKSGIRKKSIPVHARPFLNKRFAPIIYNAAEVRREYKDFNAAHPTKLHISIPCTVNGMVVAVLQITSYEDCLGPKSCIDDLVSNVLVIYTSYIKTVYMHQIEHERLAEALSHNTQEV